jgi:hypothetical protein
MNWSDIKSRGEVWSDGKDAIFILTKADTYFVAMFYDITEDKFYLQTEFTEVGMNLPNFRKDNNGKNILISNIFTAEIKEEYYGE